jgi:acetolactate synthase-1/2/3 large subunit
MLGMHGTAFANYAVEDCDFLIAVGARFDDRVAGVPKELCAQNPPHRAFRHRRIGDQQGQERRLAPRGRTGSGDLDALVELRAGTGFRKDFSAAGRARGGTQARHAMNYDRDSELIQPYHVIEEINRLTAARPSLRPASASTRCGLRSTSTSGSPACG